MEDYILDLSEQLEQDGESIGTMADYKDSFIKAFAGEILSSDDEQEKIGYNQAIDYLNTGRATRDEVENNEILIDLISDPVTLLHDLCIIR
jgi:hypothetical protein